MTLHTTNRLTFNLGFLLASAVGESRKVELDYPSVKLEDIILRPLRGQFRASHTTQGIMIRGRLYSNAVVDCARCNEPFEYKVTLELDDHFYLRDEGPPDAFRISDAGVLDLGPLVREEAISAVPMQPICRPDCQGLCIDCGQNLNEADCGCDEQLIDPRFAVLQQLLTQSPN